MAMAPWKKLQMWLWWRVDSTCAVGAQAASSLGESAAAVEEPAFRPLLAFVWVLAGIHSRSSKLTILEMHFQPKRTPMERSRVENLESFASPLQRQCLH